VIRDGSIVSGMENSTATCVEYRLVTPSLNSLAERTRHASAFIHSYNARY